MPYRAIPRPEANEPDCLRCRHYYITWDATFPYGCRAMDFKSRRKPQLDVQESSGCPCLQFAPRRRDPA